MPRLLAVVITVLFLVSVDVGPARSTPSRAPSATALLAPTSAGYQLPVAGPMIVLEPFQPPPTPYAAGHRGVDLQAAQGESVLAAGDGMVQFAGAVAGRGVIVLKHPDGLSTEYEPVTPTVAVGTSVRAGQPIGRLSGRHARCAPASCLHWGARRNGEYFDPLSLLRPLGVVRLVPLVDP